MFVITFDQRDARSSGDHVPLLMERLRATEAMRSGGAVIPFQRSVADEVQGVVAEAMHAVDVALVGLRDGWIVGVGVGRIDELHSDHVLDASGPAMVHARNAVERAQTINDRVALCVEGDDEQLAGDVEGVLALIGRIVAVRTEAEWRVVDLITPGARGQQKAIADELGVSVQAVSQSVRRALWPQEWAARPAAARLLGLLDRQRSLGGV